MEKEQLIAQEADSLKRTAFIGVAISTVATLTAIVAVPMLFNHMQNVHSTLQNEIHFCSHTTDGLWEKYVEMQKFGFQGRLKRDTYQHGYNNNGYNGGNSYNGGNAYHGGNVAYNGGSTGGYNGANTAYNGGNAGLWSRPRWTSWRSWS
ncbi:hypothetical protein QR680_004208 [Steinernema hermaphroditum]|uniref:Nematode cuticle collagen N-terminal domain-containing protein n=1 Tax=Steinernema hermaphroditum TaxID=289476 RepID=A0AA39HMZ2_9BILA|nr:hypothetical protein QR680_004208 [Steinernema hermaphroditum]